LIVPNRQAVAKREARRSRLTVGMMIVCSALFAAPSLSIPSASAADTATTERNAQVSLKITPGAGGGPWRMQIENTGEGPVRIPADARLLLLELTPPATAPEEAAKRKKATPTTPPRCILPDDVRPTTDEGRDLVIPSKRSWSTTFDPLFYCFGARERAALASGTSVRASFGWPAPAPRPGARPAKTTAPSAPFAVTPVGASIGKVASAKALTADAFVLSEAVNVTKASSSTDEAAPSSVTLSVAEALDAARGIELGATVTLTNGGDRPITLLYRPDMLLFTVSGPAGTVSCGTPRVSIPIRELLSTVAPKGKLDTSVLFTTTCPPGTFNDPGIYRVLPRLDTTSTSGRSMGIKTWEGTALAKAPLLVRVRSPRSAALPPRPTLD
jgi:hypothetical protein